MKKSYSVYIFDFDGTVAYTSEDVWRSIQYACMQCSVQLPPEMMRDNRNLALASSELYRLLAKKSCESEERKFADFIRMHYRNINSFSSTVLYPEMENILKGLSGRADCFLASNKAEVALKRLIKEKAWEGYFKEVYGTLDEGGRTKEDMIYSIIMRYPEEKRSEFIYIGDSFTDIKAARENGIASIGVTYGDGDSERLVQEKPDYVVHTGEELYSLIFGG